MSTSTRPDAPAPARRGPDSHDLIRVHGARENNLKEVSVELPKRRKSVVVIEHHPSVMAHADWIIDLGPGAGHNGGRIVFSGTPAELVGGREEIPSLTADYLAAYVGA